MEIKKIANEKVVSESSKILERQNDEIGETEMHHLDEIHKEEMEKLLSRLSLTIELGQNDFPAS